MTNRTTRPAGAAALGSTPRRRLSPPPGRASGSRPAAIAVDLGSVQTRIWASGTGAWTAPSIDRYLSRGAPLVHRGRIIDPAACVSLLGSLLGRFLTATAAPPARPLVVACHPVLATSADQEAMRQVVTTAFGPARVLLLDSVRAAAIGAGAAAGPLLIVDVGAQLTECAVLVDGRIAAVRRAEVGASDLTARDHPTLLVQTVTRLVSHLRRAPASHRAAAAAAARGVVIVGDGATSPELVKRLTISLRLPVRPAASPRNAILTGAALAATAACRHPTSTA